MVAQSDRMSPEEYLEMERASEEKHEFFRGQVYAMVGASREHNLVASNLTRELGVALKERPCDVYQSDMRVKSQRLGPYTYPDVVVVRGKAEFEDSLQPDGDWRLHIAATGTVLTLASIDVTLKVDEVYLKVFDPAS